eukprot:CAMPEP_0169469676 /NCGR_PEP_ID=MMETSP1042-20121227/23605_1 /TAXON_ID=464988 /ORGANISM="Hemiselmis andersenii, Strain CCMP1180" /LENGTH=261 /DNA_ID=CAMNT_0009583165 /DNA_START=15 /DNA_END=800 /DNA_ORIENTATION=+
MVEILSRSPLLGQRNRKLVQLAPVLGVVALALVAAVVVVATHTAAIKPSVLALPAAEATINGQQYQAIAVPAGQVPPPGAILASAPPHYAVQNSGSLAQVAAPKAALPRASAVAVPTGEYGHQAEAFVTTQHGQDAVPKGNFLKGSAPSVAKLARAVTYSKAQQDQLSKDFADAVNDCSRDGGDDCHNFLHPGGQSLKAFEEDQDRADSGLFSSFERVQSMRGSGPSRLPKLAQTDRVSFGQGGVGKYGIPSGGSLPGDDV